MSAADLVLLAHALWVLVILAGIPAVWLGYRRGWGWVRRRGLRLAHAGMMGIVTAEVLLGLACPLTLWENALRRSDGRRGFDDGGFVAHWVGRLLYYDAPGWVFTATYVAVMGVIVWLYRRFPPGT